MTAADLASIVSGGGTVAFAAVVWWELREFRKAMTWWLLGGRAADEQHRNGRPMTPPPF